MSKTIASAVALAALLGSSAVFAGERTVTLNVRNMYCDLCPHTVKASLEAVPGVANAVVSFKGKTAIVTYDDSKTNVNALTDATTKAGYPSAPQG
jgi:mercuric ion binding protein